MNLAPLYRVTEEPIKKQLASLRPEKLTAEKLQELKSWCSVDNWNRKFLGKYKISMVNTSAELRAAAAEYEPLRILIEQSNLLADPAAFRQALETAVWKNSDAGRTRSLHCGSCFIRERRIRLRRMTTALFLWRWKRKS